MLQGATNEYIGLKRRAYAAAKRDTSALSLKIRALFENAGIKSTRKDPGYSQAVAEVGFHSLRHSFVSLMENAGAPLALVHR